MERHDMDDITLKSNDNDDESLLNDQKCSWYFYYGDKFTHFMDPTHNMATFTTIKSGI